MVTWNSQALFATHPARQQAKQVYLNSALLKYDIVMLQETHATPGTLAAWQPPGSHRAFHSCGSARQGGVAILVSYRLLDKFDPIPGEAWRETEPGRVATLTLRGPEGNLDLTVVYLYTGGHRRERHESRTKIAQHIKRRDQALTVIAGDFNYTTDERGRANMEEGQWTGEEGGTEERSFVDLIGRPNGVHEAEQEEYTHSHAGTYSKLDRVYLNPHVSEQLDHKLRCFPLNWITALSDHRPVVMCRTRDHDGATGKKAVPMQPALSPDWGRRVHLCWHEKVIAFAGSHLALRRMLLLKEAITEVAHRMAKEGKTMPPSSTHDKVSITMACIREVELMHWDSARTLSSRYTALQGMLDWEGQDLHTQPGLRVMKDHAVELYEDHLLEEMREQQDDEDGQLEGPRKQMRRQQLATKIAKLRPGSQGTLKAMIDEQGQVRHSAEEMAGLLKSHWEETFKKKDVDEEKLQQWLKDFSPPEQKMSFPDASWTIRRSDVARAIKLSGKSAPGPDGIAYQH